MSRISAVICELNPAHNGHRFIFEKAKEQGDIVIAVMSGNYVQRAQTAIYDKYRRAKDAIEIGADLVLELPFPWSSASAEFFACAGVSIAESVFADTLVFGSECGDINSILAAAEIMKSSSFNSSLAPDKRAAKQREELLYSANPELPKNLLSSENDILGIEYCKHITKAKPYPVKRISCESATTIREDILNNINEYKSAVDPKRLSELEFLYFRIAALNDYPYAKANVPYTKANVPYAEANVPYAEANGGVGNRLYKSAILAKNGEEMFYLAKTKQYTNARLRRAALYCLTNVENELIRQAPLFSVVLAANEKGRKHLSAIRKKCNIKLITKPADGKMLYSAARNQYEKSLFADQIYTLCTEPRLMSEYFIKHKPFMM